LYDQGFTISGARNKMQELLQVERDRRRNGEVMLDGVDELDAEGLDGSAEPEDFQDSTPADFTDTQIEAALPVVQLRRELFEIRELLLLDE